MKKFLTPPVVTNLTTSSQAKETFEIVDRHFMIIFVFSILFVNLDRHLNGDFPQKKVCTRYLATETHKLCKKRKRE